MRSAMVLNDRTDGLAKGVKMGFARATIKPFYLRLALDGPAGSGKTYTALEIATFFAAQYGERPPAFIDTERGSASRTPPASPSTWSR